MGWRNDIRLELMREAEGQTCRRCGCPLDERDVDSGQPDPVCDNCLYNDWHEEHPDLESEDDDG
jgi:hypothetical protein